MLINLLKPDHMEQNERKEYLNNCINKTQDFSELPSSLFKYRKFDEYTFEMLEQKYVFLSPADKQDDETECMAHVNIEDLVDLQTTNLKAYCVDKIIENISPHLSKENHDYIKYKFHRIMTPSGTVRNHFMLDFESDLKKECPNLDTVALINAMANIPNQLDTPKQKEAIEKLITIALSARKAMGICSLGETCNNDDLWKRYGGNYTGYCIEYDIENYKEKANIFPVLYVDESKRETNAIIQIINTYVNVFLNKISDGKIKVDFYQYLSLFLTKYLKWSQQNEWRILGNAYDHFIAPKVKKIIVGSNASAENIKKIKNYCYKNNIDFVQISKNF